MYDRACDVCDWLQADVFEPVAAPDVRCPQGHATHRVWLPTGRSAAVVDDSIPGGLTLENLGHEPVTVYSKSELRREMDARGVRPFVRHVGAQGSDKSKHTTRWI